MEKFKTRSGLSIDQINDWVESLKLKNVGFSTNINNKVLFEAMKSLLIIETLTETDLIDQAHDDVNKNINGEVHWEDVLQESVRSVLRHIEKNMSYK